MNNEKNITKPSKPQVENEEAEMIARYTKSAYFQEKDRKAAEFLKEHPIPAKFLK